MKNFFIKLALRFLPCAFDATNMNRIQGGTCTLWIYKTVEAIATVVGSGYFNDYAGKLNNGDVILVSDTNVPTIDVFVVTSADGATTVTTANGT
jgi:hypothetical protein